MANNSWMQARQTKFAAYTAVYVLIIFAVIGVVNFLANRYNKSTDLTANKQFTLSDQTQKVVKDLKGDVAITYWDAPADAFPSRARSSRALQEPLAESRGPLRGHG
jgi:ABC-type uncharacterized transport system involved in gliding motility auxiliary subunit